MFHRKITAKNLTMPFAAFTMAGLVFIYSRTAIRAAKNNAAMHREADGGQISWQNQSLRQHGLLESPTASVSDNNDHNPSLVERALDKVAGGVPREQKQGGTVDSSVGSDNNTTSYTEQRIRERVKEGK